MTSSPNFSVLEQDVSPFYVGKLSNKANHLPWLSPFVFQFVLFTTPGNPLSSLFAPFTHNFKSLNGKVSFGLLLCANADKGSRDQRNGSQSFKYFARSPFANNSARLKFLVWVGKSVSTKQHSRGFHWWITTKATHFVVFHQSRGAFLSS